MIRTIWIVVTLFGLLSTARADRLINSPIGRKIPLGTYRIEYMPFLGNTKSADTFIGFGLNEIFDCELRDSRLSGDNSTTFDASANLVAPILGVSPGISVGVVDALNRTSDGRRAYVAITFREYLETATNDYATETTIGMQYGSLTTPFVAMSIPVSKNFRFLAEHNGFRLTGGFEIKPFPSIGIKLLAQERGVLGSVSWTAKF